MIGYDLMYRARDGVRAGDTKKRGGASVLITSFGPYICFVRVFIPLFLGFVISAT